MVEINNNLEPMMLAKQVLTHISSNRLLSQTWIDRLSSSLIRTPVHGFLSAAFPMFELGHLSSETWIGEDILNVLCELCYYRTSTISDEDGHPYPGADIILPTLFGSHARQLAEGSLLGLDTSAKLIPPTTTVSALFQRILTHPPQRIHTVTCENHHYSTQTYHTATGALEHRDSLGSAAPSYLLPMFQRLASSNGLPLPSEIISVPVPTQRIAHGSCGIAAINFVETQAAGAYQWHDTSSQYYRNIALRDLVLYHLVASEHSKVS
jgi:hypothetical protein